MIAETRSHVHEMVDRLAPSQLEALETLLNSMLDPLARRLAMAPVDDEPYSDEDRRAVAEADRWLAHNEPIPLEDVLASVGLSMDDWKAMAR